MKCSNCGAKAKVVNSTARHGCVYRSHKCPNCGRYFYSQEVEVPRYLATKEITAARSEYKRKQENAEIRRRNSEILKSYAENHK